MPVHAVSPIRFTDSLVCTISVKPDARRELLVRAEEVRLTLPRVDQEDPNKIATAMTTTLQRLLDSRQDITTLPDSDPDKTTDPTRLDLFWEVDGSRIFLVGRAVTALITWERMRYVISLTKVVA